MAMSDLNVIDGALRCGGGGSFLAPDRKGNLYFARGAKLFRAVRQ